MFIFLPTFKFCNMGDSIFNASQQFGPVYFCKFQHLFPVGLFWKIGREVLEIWSVNPRFRSILGVWAIHKNPGDSWKIREGSSGTMFHHGVSLGCISRHTCSRLSWLPHSALNTMSFFPGRVGRCIFTSNIQCNARYEQWQLKDKFNVCRG